ncbi:MAG: hypothetical protein KA160_03630, partial [Lacibacter sp.]|nr:hypothetical protein [Lacibacter sp.]
KIQEQTNDLVLATHGRGIIIVEDITPMRTITADVAANDVVMLNTKPITLTMGKYGGQFENAAGDWNGGIGTIIPPIQYYLKERANNLQLEVYDKDGKLVQKLTPSNRKGYNKVAWAQRMIPPKIAKGGNQREISGFVAPQVLPGDYTIKMKVNGKEYNHNISFVHENTNKDFTLEDRALQFKTGMELYGMHEQLAILVDSILAKQQVLKKHIDSTQNKKTKSLLEDYYGKLETLRLTLVPPVSKGTADFKRLRNDLSEVYVAVVTQEARPSNLQVQRVGFLKAEMSKAEQQYEQLNKQFEQKAMQAIANELMKKPAVKKSSGN